MAKTNLSGILGTLGTSGRVAVIVAKTGTGVARVRVLDEDPMQDRQFGPGGVGYTLSPDSAVLVDSATADTDFVAAHPAVVYLDDESGLSALQASATDLQDALLVVRDASKVGYKFFTFAPGGTVTPIVGLGPTMTITLPAPVAGTIPAATDVVIGSAGFCPALARTFRFPGDDPGSPLAATWTYLAGVLSNVPPGRARMLFTTLFEDMDPRTWRIVLQRDQGGGYSDFATLWGSDFTQLLTTTLSVWPGHGVVEFPVVDGDQFRVIIRQTQLIPAAADLTLLSLMLLLNTVGVQT